MSISEGRFLDILGENLIVIARLPFNTTRRVFSIEAFAAAITNLSPRHTRTYSSLALTTRRTLPTPLPVFPHNYSPVLHGASDTLRPQTRRRQKTDRTEVTVL